MRALPDAEVADYLDFVTWRFGLDLSVFAGHRLVRLSKKTVAIATAEAARRALNGEAHLVGMAFLRTNRSVPKLTTAAAQRFGPMMTANTVALHGAELRAFVKGEPLYLDSLPERCEHGDVVVRREVGGSVLGVGVGFLRVGETSITLESRFPKAWAGISAKDR
jgi:hypothetical protein